MEKSKRFAFTLAEVLITLGIIGVVAALTIPTLINNYQTKSWNTAADVFEKKLEQSLRVMNTQGNLSGYKTTGDFVNELKKHMNILKVCENVTDCISPEITWEVFDLGKGSTSEILNLENVKTATDLGQKNWKSEAVGLQFANGVTAVLAYNDYDCKQDPFSNSVSVMNCVSTLYDTSGMSSPNTTNKDVRGINTKVGRCVLKSGDACFSAPKYVGNGRVTMAECEALKEENFGHNDCLPNDNDRWLYAAKYCGGLDKLPTTAELKNLADMIYGTDTTAKYNTEKTGLTLNQSVLQAMGIEIPEGGLDLWAKEEMSNWYSYYRHFGQNSTKYSGYTRYYQFYAICKD